MIATFATSQIPENKPWYKFKWFRLGEHASPFEYTSWQGTGSPHLFFGEKSPNGNTASNFWRKLPFLSPNNSPNFAPF